MPDLDQQKEALNAFLGAGNSVMDRMRVDGVNVDENGDAGLDVQSAIFKRFQAGWTEKKTQRLDGTRLTASTAKNKSQQTKN